MVPMDTDAIGRNRVDVDKLRDLDISELPRKFPSSVKQLEL